MAGLVEAVMKKNKEILKFTIGGVFAYMLPYLIGVYMGFYQGANLQFMLQIAGFVTIFIVVGGLIWLFRKQYDSRKLNGYIYLFGSLGLLMEVMFWGNIFGEKTVSVCIVIYIVTFILGILILLLAMRKIIIKNKLIREIGKVVGTVGGFFIIFMVRVGKAFSGRRGEVIFRNMDSDDTMKLMWSCILFLACIYGLICSMNITSLAIED